MVQRIPFFPKLAGKIIEHFPANSLLGRRLNRLGGLLRLNEEQMVIEAMSHSAVSGRGRMDLLAPETAAELPANGIPSVLTKRLELSHGLHPVERLLHFDLKAFTPDLNLNYTDKMGMMAGIEIRVPLLDVRLAAYAAQLPLSEKIDWKQTKIILRQSQLDRLPKAILTRDKQGFGAPVRAWLAGPARPLLDYLTSTKVLEDRGLFDPKAVARLKRAFLEQRSDVAFSLFSIISMELWMRALDITRSIPSGIVTSDSHSKKITDVLPNYHGTD